MLRGVGERPRGPVSDYGLRGEEGIRLVAGRLLRWERGDLTAQGADVDAVVVRGGAGEDVAGAQAVLVLEFAGLLVEAIQRAVDAADVELAVGVGEAGVVDDVGDGRFPELFASPGVPGEGLA